MPLVKRGGAAPPSEPKTADDRIASQMIALTASDPGTRWDAARALGGRAEAVPSLAAALNSEQVPRVREAIMTALMRVGDKASVSALLPYLRSQDAGVRSSAIEALQALQAAHGRGRLFEHVASAGRLRRRDGGRHAAETG